MDQPTPNTMDLHGRQVPVEPGKKTIVSFNHRFEIPGGQVLPAGKYVFKVLDPAANPNIIQILSEDEKHLYATIMAIPKYRLRQTDKTVMTFSSRTTGAAEAIRTWVRRRTNTRAEGRGRESEVRI